MPDVSQEARAVWAELDAEDAAAEGKTSPDMPSEPAPKPDEQQQTTNPSSEPEQKAPTTVAAALTDDERSALKKQIDELTGLVKSTVGRVSALQSEMTKIGTAAATKVGDAPNKDQIAASSASPEKWQQLKSDFPDWAEAVEAYVGSKVQAGPAVNVDEILTRARNDALSTVQSQRDAEITEEIGEKHEDGMDVIRSDSFKKWLDTQPKSYADRVAGTMRASLIIDAIDKFKAASTPPANQQPTPKSRLAAAAIPSGTPKSALLKKSVDEMSDQEYWAYLNEQDRKSGA